MSTRSKAEGRSRAEDGRSTAILIRDAKARNAPAENSCASAIAGPYRLPFDRLLEGKGGGSIRAAPPQGAIMTSIARPSALNRHRNATGRMNRAGGFLELINEISFRSRRFSAIPASTCGARSMKVAKGRDAGHWL
ncbi:hypothetical protein NLM31_06320 [Bradyrhizobium sp. CCGUVB4N]|uniref:hypothetical protein n=1 Tax=Bradyrhizobium sp. CCGUVB4N TaxID=2949631 RepID=UPI0020B2BD9E|nr:hypothetical protein [Bradyrhizobium sp. CCGUVB4N]MCP3380054.1 hypothetical protein [Bradyrhizobium sp. CCGUVB4N]